MNNDHENCVRHGMVFNCDSDVLDACCEMVLRTKKTVQILEIGMWKGLTALGFKKFIEGHGGNLNYWGIDPGLLALVDPPFPGAHIITGKSEESFHLVPGNFDIIFVDGNHSRNAVILDTFNYETKVVPGGFMVFHDTNPQCQHTGYEYEGPHIAEFGIAVREAWEMIGWPWEPWAFFMEKYPMDHHQNGTTAFRKG
jgi:hypothetical protein